MHLLYAFIDHAGAGMSKETGTGASKTPPPADVVDRPVEPEDALKTHLLLRRQRRTAVS